MTRRLSVLIFRDDNTLPKEQPVSVRASTSPANWLIALSLAVIAGCLLFQPRPGSASLAHAQPSQAAGARGVFAFTGQLSKDSYGVFMVDVDAGTIWCYRYDSVHNMLKFVAARDWRYDRYLKDYSTEPATDFIRRLLEQQREAELQASSP